MPSSKRSLRAPAGVSLAVQIQAEHEAAEQDLRSALMHAVNAGHLLVQAKQQIPHGQWGKWLAENFEFSQQWAAGYMRLAKADPSQIESAVSVRGALKELAASSQKTAEEEDGGTRLGELEETIAAGVAVPTELMEAFEEAENLLDGCDLGELSPKEAWDLEERVGKLRERIHALLTPMERFWLKHRGLLDADRVEAIRETCMVAGVAPLIEDLGEDHYCWVGYMPCDYDALDKADTADKRGDALANPLTYHPGWARHCREVLGDKVKFATVDEMPYVETLAKEAR